MSNSDTSCQATWRPATRQLHAGLERTAYGETSEPVFLTSGFVYDNAEQAAKTFTGEITHYQYSRFGNPTVAALERRLADLEGAEACIATSTGMGAVSSALLSHVKAGDRVVASSALFGSCHWIVANLLPRYGVTTVLVDGTNMDEWAEALSEPTAAVLLESPSNPMLEILDIAAISALAHKAGAIVVVDNVFASPVYQKPLALGADVVVQEYTTTSAPSASGFWYTGEAKTLSTTTMAPALWARAEMAAMSRISSMGLEGLSSSTAAVGSDRASAHSSMFVPSTKTVVTP